MPEKPPLQFGVAFHPENPQQLRDTARRAERIGCYGLYVADHPGTCVSPFVALAAAAMVTETIRLGTYVLNTGLLHPIDTASAINTLDRVSNGRAILGVGAGHTPQEWTARGLSARSAVQRVDRMETFTDSVRALSLGQTITASDHGIELANARIDAPQAVQQPIPLLIGGNGPRVLRYGAMHAEIVSVTGLGATTNDGHRHIAKWSHEETSASVQVIERGSTDRETPATREALVQHFEITSDRQEALHKFASLAQVDVAVVNDIPFVLIGTIDEIQAQLAAHRQRWGFTSYVVREPMLNDLEAFLASAA
jgi:probable F420-dependent oxidoreductase